MIKFYTNRELSRKLNINLARWKRWSREFLPPDPLGGLQSGYARQFNPDDAFKVYIGGHLVGNLKFTIPESKQILNDLHMWLVNHNFYFNFADTAKPEMSSTNLIKYFRIVILRRTNLNNQDCDFFYLAKGSISDDLIDHHGIQVRQERFIESAIDSKTDKFGPADAESYQVLNISTLRKNFLNCLSESKNIKSSTN